MKWKKKQGPQIGDRRTITKFLWLPVCVKEEWRWLEKASISQRYGGRWDEALGAEFNLTWENIAWND